MSGPDELRKAVLQSVLNWHFAKEVAGGTRQVSVTFELPKEGAPAPSTGVTGGVAGGVIGGIVGGVPGGAGGGAKSFGRYGNIVADQLTVDNSNIYVSSNSVLKSISVSGISDQAKADLLARLPVHEGDTLPANISDVMKNVGHAVVEFDEHLRVGINVHNGVVEMRISPDEATSLGNSETPKRIQVGGKVEAVNLLSMVRPEYPPEAKAAGIQGIVSLSALIGADGKVQNLMVLSGHPLLVKAALEAVKNWVYKPTLINGEPVEVKTTIDINFTLQ